MYSGLKVFRSLTVLSTLLMLLLEDYFHYWRVLMMNWESFSSISRYPAQYIDKYINIASLAHF